MSILAIQSFLRLAFQQGGLLVYPLAFGRVSAWFAEALQQGEVCLCRAIKKGNVAICVCAWIHNIWRWFMLCGLNRCTLRWAGCWEHPELSQMCLKQKFGLSCTCQATQGQQTYIWKWKRWCSPPSSFDFHLQMSRNDFFHLPLVINCWQSASYTQMSLSQFSASKTGHLRTLPPRFLGQDPVTLQFLTWHLALALTLTLRLLCNSSPIWGPWRRGLLFVGGGCWLVPVYSALK